MNRLLTVKDLQALKGVVWSDNIRTHITEANVLLFHSISELASLVELFLPIHEVEEVAPETIQAIEGGAEYFRELHVPRPFGVELILLQLQRVKAGLEPDGNDELEAQS